MSQRNYVLLGVLFLLFLIGGTVFALAAETPTTTTEQKSSGNDEYILNEKSNLDLNFKNKEDELNNWRRQINDQKKCAPSFDATVVEGHFTRWGVLIGEGRALVNQISIADQGPIQPAWDKNGAIDDLRYDVQNEIDKLNQECDKKNKLNTCDERRKELDRNLRSQMKDLKRRKGSEQVDTASLEGYITQFEGCINNVCTDAGIADSNFWDNHRDCEDIRTDFYDTINQANEVVNKAECKVNAQNWIKDTDRDLNRNIKREYERLVRQAPDGQVPELQTLFEGMQKSFTDLQSVASTIEDCNDFNDLQRDFDDLRTEFWDVHRELNETVNLKQQTRDALNNIKNNRRDEKNLQREFKRITKEIGSEPQELKDAAACVNQKLTEAEAAVNTDPQAAWDALSEAGQCNQDFWNAMQDYNQKANVNRQCSDQYKREASDMEREIKRVSRESIREGGNQEAIGKLQKVADEFKSLKDTLCSQTSGGKFDDIQDIEQQLQDVRENWGDAMRQFYEGREFKFLGERLNEVSRYIERAIKKLAEVRESGRYPSERLEVCGRIVVKGKSLVEQLQEAYQNRDREAVTDLLEELEFLKGQGGPHCGFLFGESKGPDVRQFIQVNLEAGDLEEVMMQQVLDKVSAELVDKVMTRILTVQASLMQQMMDKIEQQLAGHMATVFESIAILPEQYQNEILEAKNQTLSVAEQLKAIASRKGGEQLDEVLNKVEKAVVVGDAAAQLKSEVERFVAVADTVSGKELNAEIQTLQERINSIINAGQEELYEREIVPYKDVSIDQWYAHDVFDLTQSGIVAGKKDAKGKSLGVFSPGQKVKVAEVLRMIFEATGVGPASGAPDLTQARDHWAQGYVKRAEDEDLTLIRSRADINRDATRAEVCRMILEAQHIVPVQVQRVEFPDVAAGDPNAAYIQECKNVGLFQGDGQGNFRPNDGINRAEAAKVVRAAQMIHVDDSSVDTSDLENFEGFEFSLPEIQSVETAPSAAAPTPTRSRCWWDDQCTDLMSASLVTPDDCRAAGGEGWGPDEKNCTPL